MAKAVIYFFIYDIINKIIFETMFLGGGKMENHIKIILIFFFIVQSISFTNLSKLDEEIISDNIKNFYKVSDGIYRSSQPNRKSMELLDAIGIKTILNLRRYHSDNYEAKFTGINLERIKMKPGKINDEDVIQALKTIKNAEKPILIHCWHGSDRTGVIVAMYRILFENYTKEEAISELRDKKYGYHEAVYGNIVKYIENSDIEKMREKIL